MKLSGIKPSSQDNASSGQLSLDGHESELRQQITSLREKKKSISNDKDKTSEEKKKEKQAVQEEIQTLSSELRQYQIQKRQEEAAKKREELKEAMDASAQESEKEPDPEATVFGSKKSGVLITLSAAKKQLLSMQRTQKDLEGKQRIASTEEEKADIQKRVNNVSKNIGRKITITEDGVTGFRASGKKSNKTGQVSDQPFNWRAQKEIVTAADDSEESYRGNLALNRKKFFSTVSVFIR
ncbi:MAG: FlxA-like family protein [Eubacterium sp.]|nr:FlxA-like family protein [Eubacterium sp.]MCM1213876.1 FlxA-like family protein [Lachnospiraceae bacterium]MCM1240137.1 FlxA-like family protein [Lachnospiraceae bacterium]